MERQAQQTFLSAYVVDFVEQVLEDGHTPFAGETTLPEKYSGCDVVLRVDEKSQVLFQAGEESRPEVTAENLTADWVVASSTLEFPQSSGSVMLREIEAVG